MIIKKSKILSLDKYLSFMQSNQHVYVCVPAEDDTIRTLQIKCGLKDYEVGRKFVPNACGPVTRFNMDGKEVICKDREKESRTFERDYHVIDWHGNDHYGTCFQTRMCFPKEIILPPIEGIICGERIIRSELVSKADEQRLKLIINIFLELFGYCEILDENEKSINQNLKVKTVSWKILPPGEYPWNKAKNELQEYFKNAPEKNKRVLINRHKTISEQNPDFIAIGQDSFSGYVVYGYEKKNLYIFESDQTDNATYIFKGKWKEASQLTKRDIIQGKLCYKRLIHSQEWENKLKSLF